ncbi:conserved hypothetical protein [Xenorhabdus nematophila F1]|uniref:hypothetical protein n=1 Tax=Xenorhabdus nematophila TaxID=628 RepID=UPI00032756D2|nr:hypothetical protein [Xenorhabdus nematophila]CCW30657.1 conserved hypothetical protein [Xenorhabdus nematophila F1]
MNRLQQLTTFLRENLPENIGKTEFTCETGKIRFIQAQRDLGLGQYQMFIQKYDAVTAAQHIASVEGYVLTVGATNAVIKAAQTLRANTIGDFSPPYRAMFLISLAIAR